MKFKISKDRLVIFIITFLLILFKYIEMWGYIFTKQFLKSKLVIVITVILILLFLFNMKIEKTKFKRLLFIGLLCFIISFISKSIDFLVLYILALLYINKENEKNFVMDFMLSSLFLFIVTLSLSFLNIIPSLTTSRIINNEIITRHNLGFMGANSLFMFFFPIVVSIYYLNFQKKFNTKVWVSILIVLLSVIFYNYTNCRTGILCVIIVSALFLFNKLLDDKIFQFLIKYSFIILLIVSLIFSLKFFNYENPLNKLSSGRFNTWYYYVSRYKYSLIGISPVNLIPLDNIYLNFYYFYGLVSYIICVILSLLPYNSNKIKKDFYFIVFAFCLYGFFEANISYNFNYLPFFLIYYYVNKSNKEGVNYARIN